MTEVERGTATKIDLNPPSTPEISRSSGSAGAAGQVKDGRTAADASNPLAEDVAHLSTGSDAVAKLKVQLEQIPDVRQARIEGLRQAISEGSFKVSPERIAQAMLARDDEASGS